MIEVLDEAPLEIERHADMPGCATVRVVCAGGSGEQLRCVLDSGARQTEIVDGAATVANRRLDPVQSRRVFSASPSEMGDLPELSVAGVRRTGMPVTIAAPDIMQAENLLGLDFLEGHAWRISFASRALARVGLDPEDAPWTIRRAPHGQVCFDVRWETTSANAVWDTGASITVVDRSFAATHPDLFTQQGEAPLGDGISSRQIETALMRGPAIESLLFDDSTVAIVDLSEHGHGERIDLILGYPLISQADWIVDLRRDRWCAFMAHSQMAVGDSGNAEHAALSE